MDIIINKRPVSVPILPIVAMFSLVILLFMSARIAPVGGNEVGVFVNNLTGSVTVVQQTGSSLYNGLYTDFYTLDKAQRTIRMVRDRDHNDEVQVKTGDGSDIQLDVEINYQLIVSDKAIGHLVSECGLAKVQPYGRRRRGATELVDAYHEKWIRDYSRSIVRHAFGELNPKDFYDSGKRDFQAEKARKELNERLEPHGLVVTQVVPGEYSYYAEYKQLIDDKKAADQEVESQIEEAKTAAKDQERQVQEATAKIEPRINEVNGTLDAALRDAEAAAAKARLGVEAEAYTITTDADAALTRATNEALGNLALATAEAEGLRKLAESLAGKGGINLVKLKYADVIKGATISGVPYATDPRIQKIEIDTKNAVLGGKK